jgi:Family of unknown function (DUF6448)
MKSVLPILVGASLFILAPFSRTLAHCDGLDGPVVQAAQKAIATGDVNLVLIWVQKRDEDEVRKIFKETIAVRKLSLEARELADMHFFETLVCIEPAKAQASPDSSPLAATSVQRSRRRTRHCATRTLNP